MTNAFAPKQHTADTGTNNSTPFGDDDDEGIEIPAAPVGVLRGRIVEAKKILDKTTDKVKGYMLEVKCLDPAYAGSQDTSIWIPQDKPAGLTALAGALGLTVESNGNRRVFVNSEGVRGLKAFKGQNALFLYVPYQDGPSLCRFGAPKDGYSPAWDQYMAEAEFKEAHLKALKRVACGCVIPQDAADLFM